MSKIIEFELYQYWTQTVCRRVLAVAGPDSDSVWNKLTLA